MRSTSQLRPAQPGKPRPPATDAEGGGGPALQPLPSAVRPPAPPTVAFLLVGALTLGAFVLVYSIAVLGEAGQQVENLALLGSDFRSAADREQALQRLAPVSVVTFALALVGAVLVGALRRRAALGLGIAAVMSVAVVTAELLKEGLPRPALAEGPGWLLRNSFPSGTAAVVAAVAVALIVVVPDRLRWLGLLVAAVLVAVVAHALQVSGWHRLSDVVGGTLLVVSVASFSAGALSAAGWAAPLQDGAIHPVVYRLLVAGALGAGVVAVLVLLLLLAFPLLGSPEGSRRAFLQTAFPLLGSATSVLAVALFARVAQRWSFGRQAERTVSSTP